VPSSKIENVHLPEVWFEFRRVGRLTRVVAIDPITGTEVVMVGAPGYSTRMLKRLGARKLAYVIARKRRAEEEGDD
jgi:hypothetical protein